MVVEKEGISRPNRHIIFTVKEIFLKLSYCKLYLQGRRLLEADLTT